VINVAILGSTGSIGQSALSVVAAHPDRLRVVGLAAGENIARFVEQVAAFAPETIAMSTPRALADARTELQRRGVPETARTVASGSEGLIAVATHADAHVVLFASSGTAALDAVLAAIEAGKTIALANKEILVMAGGIVMEAARRRGVAVLPVDSEHNAIHQCLHGRSSADVRRLILTASGGPFRDTSEAALQQVTPDEALRRGAQASDVVDGSEDHDRFGDADEQGTRSHRSAVALRRRAGSDPRARAPAIDRPLDGRND
jgi:1-deoxy-D-xylulose-5-phosphate reductoisomerase